LTATGLNESLDKEIGESQSPSGPRPQNPAKSRKKQKKRSTPGTIGPSKPERDRPSEEGTNGNQSEYVHLSP
jgi:hypothetical protein